MNNNKKENKGNKKPLYKKGWFWIVIVIVALCSASVNKKDKDSVPATADHVEQVYETPETPTEETTEADGTEIPVNVKITCRALAMIFVKNVVHEDWQMTAFDVEEFELDENENGTIKILYMPSGATKVNLTITKSDNVYTVEYAMLAGSYEVDMSTVSNQYKILAE